jgi:hypothetical protein
VEYISCAVSLELSLFVVIYQLMYLVAHLMVSVSSFTFMKGILNLLSRQVMIGKKQHIYAAVGNILQLDYN